MGNLTKEESRKQPKCGEKGTLEHGWWGCKLVHHGGFSKNEKQSFHSVVVRLLGCVWLFATPGTAVCQASLSSTLSGSLIRFMSIQSVTPSNHLILYHMTQQFYSWVYAKQAETLLQKDTCTSVFIASLFTIAKWKQCKCPSIDEWIKKIWCIYAMEYSSIIKKNEILWNFAICSNMNGLKGHYAKWNKSGRERQILYGIT